MLTSAPFLNCPEPVMTQSAEALQQQIARGAAQLNIELSAGQLQLLSDYLQLLIKWNKAYNLTAIREPERMVPLHLLDSLAVHSYIQDAQNIIDVGTGPVCRVWCWPL